MTAIPRPPIGPSEIEAGGVPPDVATVSDGYQPSELRPISANPTSIDIRRESFAAGHQAGYKLGRLHERQRAQVPLWAVFAWTVAAMVVGGGLLALVEVAVGAR